jgi:hypothetical protein
MKVIKRKGRYVLCYENAAMLPYSWYEDHGNRFRADGRNDGLIYISGHQTAAQAHEYGTFLKE